MFNHRTTPSSLTKVELGVAVSPHLHENTTGSKSHHVTAERWYQTAVARCLGRLNRSRWHESNEACVELQEHNLVRCITRRSAASLGRVSLPLTFSQEAGQEQAQLPGAPPLSLRRMMKGWEPEWVGADLKPLLRGAVFVCVWVCVFLHSEIRG